MATREVPSFPTESAKKSVAPGFRPEARAGNLDKAHSLLEQMVQD